jgi:hypothetical protein
LIAENPIERQIILVDSGAENIPEVEAQSEQAGGLDTQFNALDADRNLLSAELTLEQVRRAELVAMVQLYNAL